MNSTNRRKKIAKTIEETDSSKEVDRVCLTNGEGNIICFPQLVADDDRTPNIVHEDAEDLTEEGEVLAECVEDEFSSYCGDDAEDDEGEDEDGDEEVGFFVDFFFIVCWEGDEKRIFFLLLVFVFDGGHW